MTQQASDYQVHPPRDVEIESNDDPAARLRELDQQLRSFVTEHPFAAVFGAAAVGYLVGRIISRF